MIQVYRQGDVLLRPVEPGELAEQVKQKGKVVKSRTLRRGEHGGIHALEAGTSAQLIDHNRLRYVLAPQASAVVHGEHNRLPFPAGLYQVVVQREGRGDSSARFVVD